MTLYTQKERNIHRTWILMSLFLVFIIGLGWIFSRIFDNSIILYIAIIFSVLINFFSYWYSDKIVLAITHARQVKKEDNPELYRLVENLAITAGLPLPKIYIINELQPNAFATGRDKNHAVIAVTQGLLERLERVELEGVIAHELAHIGNRDILLSTVIVILVGFIAMLSDLFLRFCLWGIGGRRKGVHPFLLLFGIVAAILAPTAAMIIQLAISRKREFLADATGALLTRYPEGLCRALKKISDDLTPLKTASSSTAHLYISNPFKGKQAYNWFTKLFLTHPPIEERIKALQGMKV